MVVSLDKITNALRELALVTEAVSTWFLWSGGLTNNLVPIAQFDQFDKLDGPVMIAGNETEPDKIWKTLSDERNQYLDPLDDLLFAK